MVGSTVPREFPIEWRHPEDAEKSWVWDGMHCPRPLTPLSQDFFLKMTRLQAALGATPTGNAPSMPMFVNGFPYNVVDLAGAGAAGPQAQEMQRRNAGRARNMRRWWTGTYLPRVRRARAFIVDTDTSGMSTPQMRDHLSRCLDRGARAFSGTLEAAGPMFEGIGKFYDMCEKELGADGISLAGAAVQGYDNESSLSDRALSEVAETAKLLNLDKLILDTPVEQVPPVVKVAKGGPEFLRSFNAYLDRYGWRPPTWFELSEGCWRENPVEPLRLLRRFLAGESEDPRQVQRAVVRKRKAAVRRLRQHFGKAGRLDEFEEAWRTARQFVPVSEGRALWQLSLGGFLRVPALALGRRLAAEGALESESDIFYLYIAELASAGDKAGWPSLVTHRRAEREHYSRIVPPMTIGRPPALPPPPAGQTGPTPQLPIGARLVSGFGGERSLDERVLKGHAASPGVAQGPARVVETIDQADKVQDGDILVCRFTTPSWTPLFSRVAAIVADSGGVLSHCAILSREYGIPCVPGVRVGTRRIRDGMMLTVDGTQGIVRLDTAG